MSERSKDYYLGLDDGIKKERARWLAELKELDPSDPAEWEGYKTGWYAALEELRRRMREEER